LSQSVVDDDEDRSSRSVVDWAAELARSDLSDWDESQHSDANISGDLVIDEQESVLADNAVGESVPRVESVQRNISKDNEIRNESVSHRPGDGSKNQKSGNRDSEASLKRRHTITTEEEDRESESQGKRYQPVQRRNRKRLAKMTNHSSRTDIDLNNKFDVLTDNENA